MAAIYSVFTSPHHTPLPNHLPTLIITPHGQPQQILYSYLHTDYNTVNYLLTPSPQGDLCVAKLFPPPRPSTTRSGASDPGHAQPPSSRNNVVRCEASRELRWTIENTGVRSPIYKIVNSDDTPLYQISKPNPNADFWTMFYFAYAGHQIPPRRVEFGKVSKNPPEKGGGTRITITGKTEDEKKVWQTLGEGNEDCVEWVVACACLNLLDDEILKAAERKAMGVTSSTIGPASSAVPAGPASLSNGRPGPSAVQPPKGSAGVASSLPPPGRAPHAIRSNPNMSVGSGGQPIHRSTSADPRAAGGVSVPLRQGQAQMQQAQMQQAQMQHKQQQRAQLPSLETGQYPVATGPRSADPYARDPRYAQQSPGGYQQQQQQRAQMGPQSARAGPPPGHDPRMRSPQPPHPQMAPPPQQHQGNRLHRAAPPPSALAPRGRF